ncbi:MAG: GTP-binding protein [Chloroflexota bacterium]
MSEVTDQHGAALRTTRELAQAISSVERGGPAADTLIQTALTRIASERNQNAVVIGVTGPPGAGKSTLVGALADLARSAGRRVAILAVDPSSVASGGALLGDRVRVDERPGDEGRFVRSIATRGSGRSLSHTTAAASLLVEAAGFNLVFIETVGAGQADLGIVRLADLVLLVEGPEGGDEVQAMKARLLESAHLVVVNKSDRPGADLAVERLRSGLALGHDAPQVLLASAVDGSGVAELLTALEALAVTRSGGGLQRRIAAHLASAVEARAAQRLRDAESDGRLSTLAQSIATGERPLSGAVDELLKG